MVSEVLIGYLRQFMLISNDIEPFDSRKGDGAIDIASLSLVSINTMKDMVVWIAADGSIVFANASAKAHFGRWDPDLISRKIYEIDRNYSEVIWHAHWQELLDRKSLRLETAHCLSQTETVPVEVSANLVTHCGVSYICAIFHDITQRKRLQAEILRANDALEKLALTDPLTGLGNRREFERRILKIGRAHV